MRSILLTILLVAVLHVSAFCQNVHVLEHQVRPYLSTLPCPSIWVVGRGWSNEAAFDLPPDHIGLVDALRSNFPNLSIELTEDSSLIIAKEPRAAAALDGISLPAAPPVVMGSLPQVLQARFDLLNASQSEAFVSASALSGTKSSHIDLVLVSDSGDSISLENLLREKTRQFPLAITITILHRDEFEIMPFTLTYPDGHQEIGGYNVPDGFRLGSQPLYIEVSVGFLGHPDALTEAEDVARKLSWIRGTVSADAKSDLRALLISDNPKDREAGRHFFAAMPYGWKMLDEWYLSSTHDVERLRLLNSYDWVALGRPLTGPNDAEILRSMRDLANTLSVEEKIECLHSLAWSSNPEAAAEISTFLEQTGQAQLSQESNLKLIEAIGFARPDQAQVVGEAYRAASTSQSGGEPTALRSLLMADTPAQ